MSDEELTALQEELAAAHSEVERLEAIAADKEARAAQLETQLAQRQGEVAQARERSDTQERDLAAVREQAEGLRTQVQDSARRYRDLALQHSPELPAELVAGDTVEQIDEALQQARETVAKVRGHLESQAQAGRVPVGSPPRSGPDLSALSADEKIRMGLQQAGG